MRKPCIAIVGRNSFLRDDLALHLATHGYQTMAFSEGSDFEQAITNGPPWAVVILDMALPDCLGMSLCRLLRQRSKSVGIVMLGHKDDASDRLHGYAEGADNYLFKPLDMNELTAVVATLSRRAESKISAGSEWQLDDVCMTLTSPQGTKITLTLSEVEIVRTLARGGNHFADRGALIQSMGKHPDCYDPRALEVMVSRLRRKLGTPSPLRAVRARGYMFAADLQFN